MKIGKLLGDAAVELGLQGMAASESASAARAGMHCAITTRAVPNIAMANINAVTSLRERTHRWCWHGKPDDVPWL